MRYSQIEKNRSFWKPYKLDISRLLDSEKSKVKIDKCRTWMIIYIQKVITHRSLRHQYSIDWFECYAFISYFIQMYRQNTLAQALDFSSLRKSSNVVHAKPEGDLLLLQTQPNVALLLLAGFTLITQQIPITDAEFIEFNFEQVPKSFQQLQHEKTMNEIFNVIKARVKTIDNFCEFFNYYPVSGFVLECWVRQKAKLWV